MLATVAAGNAEIACIGIPEAMNAASFGAKTVKTFDLLEMASINPAFRTAAFRIEKLASVFRISPMVLPVTTGEGIGSAAGNSLLQDDATIIIKMEIGKIKLIELIIFFILKYL
jgi:hypothetical protein